MRRTEFITADKAITTDMKSFLALRHQIVEFIGGHNALLSHHTSQLYQVYGSAQAGTGSGSAVAMTTDAAIDAQYEQHFREILKISSIDATSLPQDGAHYRSATSPAVSGMARGE